MNTQSTTQQISVSAQPQVGKSATQTHPHKSTTTPELFFHKVFPEGEELEMDNGRIIKALTAFARPHANTGAWLVTFAECDVRDSFCKKRGRSVARRKWFLDKQVYEFAEKPNYEDVFAIYCGYEEEPQMIAIQQEAN